ncbi:MAG: hypothetical protein ILP10_06645 [Lachnospiraceae bacterium]|nr:hypothetical protein [Lachnospiraceae bacterium]
MKNLLRKAIGAFLILSMILSVLTSFGANEASAKEMGTATQQSESGSPEDLFKKEYPGLGVLAENGSIGLKTVERKAEETIRLGRFCLQKDGYGNMMPEKEDLEWQVLTYSEDGKSALVISKYIICDREFDQEGKNLTWEKCSLRKWLNKGFIEEAFSDSERALIKTSVIENGTEGASTKDRIFLLSKKELDTYLMPENKDENTDYDEISLLVRICRFAGGSSDQWMLRSEGDEPESVAIVASVGYVDYEYVDESCGVRPAFWVELTPELIEANHLKAGKASEDTDRDVYITFGTNENKEKIEWILCDYDEKENRALLLSRKLEGYMAFKASGSTDGSWKKSDIRKWLNDGFYRGVFSENEAARIKATVTCEENGETIKDRVFLFSDAEVEKYLKEMRFRYGEYPDGAAGWYWLRTLNEGRTASAIVNSDGLVDTRNISNGFGIRPAIYISLDPKASAEKIVPDVPAISATPTSDGRGITVRTSETFDADGFEIYLKRPGASKFELAATIDKDGKTSRGITLKGLDPGRYSVKVRAYRDNKKKRVYGAFAKKVRVKLESIVDKAYLKKTYPELIKLADEGLIGFNADYERDSLVLGKWGGKAIEWEVLEYSADGKSALVMSKNVLCNRYYNEKDADVKWKDCSLRKWLGGEFYKTAFSKSEKKLIKTTKVINENNEFTGNTGGKATKDKLFLLSESEYQNYRLENLKSRIIDRSIGVDLNGKICSYWLRTPGREPSDSDFEDWDEEDWEDYEEEDYLAGYAAYVYYDGDTDLEGTGVAYEQLGVRPAMWVSLTKKLIKKNGLSVKKNKKIAQVYVSFGTQTNDDEAVPLEWMVLDRDEANNRLLLLSRYIVDNIAYYDYGGGAVTDQGTTWAESSVRRWLNEDFYGAVFDAGEKALIEKVRLNNKNPEKKGAIGGKNTEDYVFFLSTDEATKYLGANDGKGDSAERIGRHRDGEIDEWWLRSPGYGVSGKESTAAAYVDDKGAIRLDYHISNVAGVRPALWIKLD